MPGGPVLQQPIGSTLVGTYNPQNNTVNVRMNYIRIEHLIVLCVVCCVATNLALYAGIRNLMGDAKAYEVYPKVTAFMMVISASTIPFTGERGYLSFLFGILEILLFIGVITFKANAWLALSSPIVVYILMSISDACYRRWGLAKDVLQRPYGEWYYFWIRVFTVVLIAILALGVWSFAG